MNPEQMEISELWNTIRNYLCNQHASALNKLAIECLDEMNRRVMIVEKGLDNINELLKDAKDAKIK
jgi:hypothetical protein